MNNPLRIMLSEAASKHLEAAGENAFVVVARGSYPHSVGRFVLYLVPSTVKQVDAAVRVALGTHRAVKVKPPVP